MGNPLLTASGEINLVDDMLDTGDMLDTVIDDRTRSRFTRTATRAASEPLVGFHLGKEKAANSGGLVSGNKKPSFEDSDGTQR